MANTGTSRKRRWVIVSGIIVVAVVSIFVLMRTYYPGLNTYMIPAHISDAISAAEPLMHAIEEFRRGRGRFPASVSEVQEDSTVQHKYVSDVQIVDKGVVRLTFSGYMQEIEGKTIVLIPITEEAESVRWSCRSDDIPFRFLPSSCR